MPRFMVVGLMLLGAVFGGCSVRGPLPLQKKMSGIQVGKTTSTEVLNQLSHEGMLYSAHSVSVLSTRGWARELAIIQFNEKDSRVGRKVYLQRRSRKNPLYMKEIFHLTVQTELSDAVLNEPHENEMRQKVAILEAIHKSIVEDTRLYSEDQQTVALMGLARSALGIGIVKLKSQPRKANQLGSPSGFSYDHPTLGKVNLSLSQDSERVYTIILEAWDRVDGVNYW